MARAANRSGFHVYANEEVIPNKLSGVFKFSTLLPVLSMKGAVEGAWGRPGSSVMIGRKLSSAKSKTLRGSTQAQIQFPLGKVGGGKYIGVDDTASSAGTARSNRKKKTAYISWFEHEQPIALENQIIDAAGGQFSILGSQIEDATGLALEEQLEQLATDMYTGNPSDQTAEIWNAPVGLDQWIHKSNTLGGIDRSDATHQYFRGQHSTASLTLSLSLIDTICLEGVDDGSSGTTTPLANIGSMADVVILPNAGYNKIKQEALSRNLGQRVTGDSLPKGGLVGYLDEFVNYNGKIIVMDPYAAASSMYILDSQTWMMELFAGKNFAVQKFQNLRELQPGTGQPDLTTSAVVTKGRVLCFEPVKNFRGTAVS